MTAAARDPLERVLDLGHGSDRLGTWLGIVIALLAHGALAARGATALFDLRDFAEIVHARVVQRMRATYEIDTAERKRPPPPPPPDTPPPPEPAHLRYPSPNAPPPAPAQAGKVLTAPVNPDDPVDLTNDGFVSGDGEHYAGGITSSAGTSKTAVYDRNAQKGGVPGGTGQASAAPPPPVEDLSRPPRPVNGNWNCGFPPEADVEQIDSANAMISVTVGPDGRALSAAVVADPGNGFGRQARQCALRMQYTPGLDAKGQPVTKTQVVTVKFFR